MKPDLPSFVSGADAVPPSDCAPPASGNVDARAARSLLSEALHARETGRDRPRSSDPEHAAEVWCALTRGRWSLIDAVERDGKRFLLARRNTPDLRARGALAPNEHRVCALAAAGLSTKLIAHELGLSTSTVSTHLKNALRKLGFGSRTQLVALYARRTPDGDVPTRRKASTPERGARAT